MAETESFFKKIQSANFLGYIIIFMANITSWVVFNAISGYNFFSKILEVEADVFNYTVLVVIFISVSIISAMISGSITDKTFNRTILIFIGFSLFSAGYILLFISYFNNAYIYKLLSYICAGSGFGLNISTIGALFGDITEPKERGKLQGISICCAYLLAMLFQQIDVWGTIPMMIFINIIAIICVGVITRNPGEKLEKEKNTPIESTIGIFKKKNYVYYVISFLLFLIALPFISVLFEPLWVSTRIDDFTLLYVITPYYYLFFALFAFIGGIAIDHFGRKEIMLFLFLSTGFGFVMWGLIVPAYALHGLVLFFVTIFLSAGLALTNTLDFTIATDFADPRSRGRMVSILFIVGNVGLLLSTLLRYFIEPLEISTIALIVTFLILLSIVPIVLATKSLDEALAKQVDVKGIYIVTQDGRCMVDATFKGVSVETDLITGALSAVGDLIKESVHSKKQLKSIDQEDVKIMISYGDHVNACIIADKETPELRKRLDKFLSVFEENYQEYIVEWSGALRPFMGAYKIIEEIFGLYV